MTIPTSYYTTIRRDNSLVAYYRLNEKAGSRAYDWAAKYRLNGVYNGAVAFNPSLIYGDASAGSKLFGENGYNVEIPDSIPLRIVGDMTFEAWIVLYEVATGTIISKLTRVIPPKLFVVGPYLFGLKEGKLRFILGDNESTSLEVISPSLIPVGVPMHVIGTCFRKTITLFVNGKIVEQKSLGAQEVKSNTEPVLIGEIGKSGGTGLLRFPGLISEVAIYNSGCSPKKALEHYNIGRRILENQPYITTYDPPSYS